MKKYFRIVHMAIHKGFAYNWAVVFNVFSSLLSIVIMERLWMAIFHGQQNQYVYMLSYSIVARILAVFFSMSARRKIMDNIRTGDIALQLLRPWNYLVSILAEEFGGTVVALGTKIAPIALIAFFLFGRVAQISLLAFPFFIVSILISYLIQFLLYAIVHLLCFWFIEVSSLPILLGIIIDFLSGSFLPAWMMPAAIKSLMEKLPFIWIYQKPIELLVGTTKASTEIAPVLLMQGLWAIVLALVYTVMWNKAIRRLIVQGG